MTWLGGTDGLLEAGVVFSKAFHRFQRCYSLTFRSPLAWTPLLLPTYVHVIPICSSCVVAIIFGGACMAGLFYWN